MSLSHSGGGGVAVPYEDELGALLQNTQHHDPSIRVHAEMGIQLFLSKTGGMTAVMTFAALDHVPLHLRQLAILLIRLNSSSWDMNSADFMDAIQRFCSWGLSSREIVIQKSCVPLVSRLFLLCNDPVKADILSFLKHHIVLNSYSGAMIYAACFVEIFEMTNFTTQMNIILTVKDVICDILNHSFIESSPSGVSGLLGTVKLAKIIFTELGNANVSIGFDEIEISEVASQLLGEWPVRAFRWIQEHHKFLRYPLFLPVFIELIRATIVIIGAFSSKLSASLLDQLINTSCYLLSHLWSCASTGKIPEYTHNDGDIYTSNFLINELFEMVNCIMTVTGNDYGSNSVLATAEGLESYILHMIRFCSISADELVMWSEEPTRFIAEIEVDEDEMSCTTRHVCGQSIRKLCYKFNASTGVSILNILIREGSNVINDVVHQSKERMLHLESILWLLQNVSRTICTRYMKAQRGVKDSSKAPDTSSDFSFVSTFLFPLFNAVRDNNILLLHRVLYSICQLAEVYPKDMLVGMMSRCAEVAINTRHVGLKLQCQRCMLCMMRSFKSFSDITPFISELDLTVFLNRILTAASVLLISCDEETNSHPVELILTILNKFKTATIAVAMEEYSIRGTQNNHSKLISSETISIMMNNFLSLWAQGQFDPIVIESTRLVMKKLFAICLACHYSIGICVDPLITFLKWLCSKVTSIPSEVLIRMEDHMLDVFVEMCNILRGLKAYSEIYMAEIFSTLGECIASISNTGVLFLKEHCGEFQLKLYSSFLNICSPCGDSHVGVVGVLRAGLNILHTTLLSDISRLYVPSVAVVNQFYSLFPKYFGDDVLRDLLLVLWRSYSTMTDDSLISCASSSKKHVVLVSMIYIASRDPVRFCQVFLRNLTEEHAALFLDEWVSFHSGVLLLLLKNNIYTLKISTIGLLGVIAFFMRVTKSECASTMSDAFRLIVKAVPTLIKESMSQRFEGEGESDLGGIEGDGSEDEVYYSDFDMYSEGSGVCYMQDADDEAEDEPIDLSDMLQTRIDGFVGHGESISSPKGLDILIYHKPQSQDVFVSGFNVCAELRSFVTDTVEKLFDQDVVSALQHHPLFQRLTEVDNQVLRALLASTEGV